MSAIRLVNTFEDGTNGTRPVAGPGNGSGERNGNAWDVVSGNTGTVLYDSTTFKQGLRSLKITADGLAAVGVTWDENSLSDLTLTTYLRFYFNVQTLPNASARIVLFQDAGATNMIAAVALRSDGKIDLVDGNGLVQATSTATIATGQWNRIETRLFSNNTTGTLDARLFLGANAEGGTPDETVSYANQYTLGNHARRVSIGSSNVVSNLSLWIDAVEYNDFNWPGAFAPPVPAQYETLFANGTYPFHTPKTMTSNGDSATYSFGMFFTAAVNGKVHGAAWCNNLVSSSADAGLTPQIALYPGGSSTAMATKTAAVLERRGTWNYELFTSPIDIVAGAEYMIVVFRKTYPNHTFYFDASNTGHGVQTQGNLTAPDVNTSNNCYFDNTGSLTKPTNAFNSSWYGIDVLFQADGASVETWGIPLA